MRPNNQSVCTASNPSDIYSEVEDITELFEGTQDAVYIGDKSIPVGFDRENNSIVVIDLDCTSEESKAAVELCERFASGKCTQIFNQPEENYLALVDGMTYTASYWH